jgi:hypothetical protein
MATDGLSLVGFMDEALAIAHLRNHCKQPDNSDAALKAIWQQAIAQLGAPVAKAGLPDIQQLSAPELKSIIAEPVLAEALKSYPGSAFCRVEIDPLLAYQFFICKERSSHHCSHVGPQSSFDELAKVCLPTSAVNEPVQQIRQDNSALIKSRSLNMQMGPRGIFADPAGHGPNAMGFQIFMPLPLAHVVRLNGRCYLHNGFHRALGLRGAGVTHIPCLFREVPDAAAAGIRVPEASFQLQLLESSNPPTLAHYTRGSAWPVKLRSASRILHVTWSDYIVYDE